MNEITGWPGIFYCAAWSKVQSLKIRILKIKPRQIVVNQISIPLIVRFLEQHCARYVSKRWPSDLEWSWFSLIVPSKHCDGIYTSHDNFRQHSYNSYCLIEHWLTLYNGRSTRHFTHYSNIKLRYEFWCSRSGVYQFNSFLWRGLTYVDRYCMYQHPGDNLIYRKKKVRKWSVGIVTY